jgi:ubiquitin-activating enzyme E1
MVAGRIIPAIATTTACITGFIGLEIFKQCRKEVDIAAYRMTSINLAVNSITLELLPDPIKVKSKTDVAGFMTKAVPEGFTTWDFINIDEPDLTLQEFIDHFKKKHHDCRLTLLGSVDKVYYNDDDSDNDAKLKLKLIDIVTKVNGQPIFPEDRNYVIFESVAVTTAPPDEDDGETPKIKWKFK